MGVAGDDEFFGVVGFGGEGFGRNSKIMFFIFFYRIIYTGHIKCFIPP